MRDLKIIEGTSGNVDFKARGLCTNEHLSVLQRLYVLLMTGSDDSYRDRDTLPLASYAGRMNRPSVEVFNGMLPILVNDALLAMDAADRDMILRASASADDDYNITCAIEFKDGTAVKGILNNE